MSCIFVVATCGILERMTQLPYAKTDMAHGIFKSLNMAILKFLICQMMKMLKCFKYRNRCTQKLIKE